MVLWDGAPVKYNFKVRVREPVNHNIKLGEGASEPYYQVGDEASIS